MPPPPSPSPTDRTVPPSSADGLAALTVVMAEPRGFCAGVVRAIAAVEEALTQFGAPVYVRHEIVHNRHVVEDLKAKGAVFVEELDAVPSGATVVFSAHGVPKAVPAEAARRGLPSIDATCPLVTKVHREAERLFGQGFHVFLIGHAGHPEVEGTLGQLPAGAITLIETEADARKAEPPTPGAAAGVAVLTQTTLSVDDTAAIVAILVERFPDIARPRRDDICFATTNRQAAVKAIAADVDLMLVVGSATSSNAQRLVETAHSHGCARALLIDGPDGLAEGMLAGVGRLGLTAGASTPELLVAGVLDWLAKRRRVSIQTVHVADETVSFRAARMPPQRPAA